MGVTCAVQHSACHCSTSASQHSDVQGRATMEMKLTLAEARENGVKSGLIKIVADGYNAPVTAGETASYSTTLAAKHAVLPLHVACACCSLKGCLQACWLQAAANRISWFAH